MMIKKANITFTYPPESILSNKSRSKIISNVLLPTCVVTSSVTMMPLYNVVSYHFKVAMGLQMQ